MIMEENRDENQINLQQFKRYNRRFPWSLIVRIIVALITIGLIVYLATIIQEKQEKTAPSFEIEIEQ